MAVDFSIVAGQTAPPFQITCKRGGSAIDLTAATDVSLIIKNKGTGSITQQGKSATITTAASGIITYNNAVTDFPTKGKYVGDIKITYTSGSIERLYKQVTWKVRDPIQ